MTHSVAHGVTGILTTPFDASGSVDHAALAHQAAAAIDWGSVGVGFGFASEVHRLTQAEQDDAVATVAAAVPDGTPVMAHVWAGSAEALLARLQAVAERGATHAMVPAPPLIPLTDASAETYFTSAAERSPVALVVQDAPAIAGSALGVDVLARLLEHPNVDAVKVEAAPSAPKVGRVVEAARGRAGVVGGGGGLDLWHELERGATGTMPSTALPEPFVRILELRATGEPAAARRTWQRLLPFLLVSQRSFDTYLLTQKDVLVRRGAMPSARLRGPNEPVDPALDAELDVLWEDLRALLAESE